MPSTKVTDDGKQLLEVSIADIADAESLIITLNGEEIAISTIDLPTAIYNGQETVDAAGTAQPIATTQALVSGVTVKALAGNAGLVYVGNSGVDAANGFELAAGEEKFIEVDDLATVYIDAATNDDGVSYIAS
jgi:hypothetical protein